MSCGSLQSRSVQFHEATNVSDSILHPDLGLVEQLVASGDCRVLRELFAARTARWKHWYFTGEASSGLFDDLESRLSRTAAYLLIPTALEIALEQSDPVLFTTALSLVAGLARASDTTEAPRTLRESWSELGDRAEAVGNVEPDAALLWAELAAWYRM